MWPVISVQQDHRAAGPEWDRPPSTPSGHPQPGQLLQSSDPRSEGQGAQGSVQLWPSRWALTLLVFMDCNNQVLQVLSFFFALFSCLDAFDNDLIISTLWEIKKGRTVHIPVYDFVTHSRWFSVLFTKMHQRSFSWHANQNGLLSILKL